MSEVLYHGDCLEVMDNLINMGVKVDLTVTSPPYDDIRNYNGTLEWNFDIFKKVADRLFKITKDGGVVVWVVGDKTKNGTETLTSFKQALYFKDIGFNIHDTMIYHKKNNIPMNHNRYEQSFEYMFILSKGKPKCFNGIREECKYANTKNSSGTFRNKNNTDNTSLSYSILKTSGIVKQTKLKTNIWSYFVGNNMSTKDKIAFKHPAIFPEKLAQDHIISWSNEGDTVLDCFMGSGTTGKMAKLLNRNFIGIEKVKEYYEISKQRIKGE